MDGSGAVNSDNAALGDYWWRLKDELRARGGARDSLLLLRTAASRGHVTDWQALASLSRLDENEIVDPIVVAEFAVAFTADRSPMDVLDPWAGLGVSLRALADAGLVRSGLAIEINAGVYELTTDLLPMASVTWQLGDAATLLAGPIGDFDLVVGSPPIGLPRADLPANRAQVSLRTSKTYTMLVQAALTLRAGGSMLAVLPEGFFGASGVGARKALEEISVFASASFALPVRAYPTSVPLSLVVFTHERHEDIFLGELDPATDMTAVIGNLRARRAARLPQLGLLVAAADFVSWRTTLAGVQIADAARTMGLRLVPIPEFTAQIRRPRQGVPPFEAQDNAVYLPSIGTSPVVTSLDALTIKPQNYLQLVMRPDVADAGYVAAFLNSPLGRKVRDQLLSGTTIRHISLTMLRGGTMPLPSTMEQQHRAVRAARQLAEIRGSIDALERRLWDRPLHANSVQTDLRKVLQGDGMERWMETLPFPLASVLWRYHAEQNAERRCGYLVHFFEGTTVFLVDLLLAALNGDPQVLADARRRTGAEDPYGRASIGIWADLLARLAKRTRDLRSRQPDLAQELFRLSDLERLDSVAGKGVVAALKDEAADYRRNWIGHAAVVGAPEWQRRLVQAEATLERVRLGLGDVFEGWDLGRAGQGANRRGVITTSIERLMGSRSLFRGVKVDLRELPEEGGLYMIESGASLALRVGSLFTLQRGPESVEDACYFYDRIEAGGVRWVSYHFEQQPELVRPDAATVHLISELNLLG